MRPSFSTPIPRLLPNLFLPPLTSNIRQDIGGAVSGTLASLPQTIAYGVLAASALGPDWVGSGVMAALFGSIILGIVAIVGGTSPLTVAGPRATTALVFSLMTEQVLGLDQVAHGPAPQLTALALACTGSALAGLLQMAFGWMRLGRLVNFIPDPVIAGFLNGSALLIILNQIPTLLGLTGERLGWAQILAGHWQGASVLLGLGTMTAVLTLPHLTRAVPALLAGMGLGVALYHLAHASGSSWGFGPTLPDIGHAHAASLQTLWGGLAAIDPTDSRLISALAPSVLSIAVLSSLDTLLAARSLDAVTQRRSNGNRELAAQGLGNFLCGAMGCLPGSGGMGRAAAMIQGGGRTALAPLLIAVLTLIAAKALMPLIHFLPQAVMAGALIVVAIQIFDPWTVSLIRRFGWRGLGRLPISDLLSVGIVMAATLLANLVVAVGAGVLISLVVFVARMGRSPVRRVYPASLLTVRLHGDIDRVRFLEHHGDKIMVAEVEGALFFGSAAALEARVERLIAAGITHVVLDLKRIKDVDTTGARTLERINQMLTRRGGALAIAHVEPERRHGDAPPTRPDRDRRSGHARTRILWKRLFKAGTIEALGPQAFFPDVDQASALLENRLRLYLEAHGGQTGRQIPIIVQNFSGSDIRGLRRHMDRLRVEPGQYVFRQGDPPDKIYFIAKGRVEITVDLAGTDRKLKIQTMTRGAIFGEMAVLDAKPRSANVVAVEPTVCYSLSAEKFAELKTSAPGMAFTLLENLALIFSERLRASGALMADLEG